MYLGNSTVPECNIVSSFNSISMNDNGQAIAGGVNGAFYSTDNGATWSLVIPSSSGINSVYIDSKGNAIAGDGNGAIWYSTSPITSSSFTASIQNEGNVWYSERPSTSGSFNPVLSLANGEISSVYIDNQGNAIVGGGSRFGQGQGQGGVWYSTEPGTQDSFRPVLSLESGFINSVYLDSQGNAIVGGYSYNNNNNVVWYSERPSMSESFKPVLSINGRINSVYIDSQGNAIVGGEFGQSQGGVWYSTTPITNTSFNPVLSLAGGVITSVYIDSQGNAIASATNDDLANATPYRSVIVNSVYLDNKGNAIAGGYSMLTDSFQSFNLATQTQAVTTQSVIPDQVSVSQSQYQVTNNNYNSLWYSPSPSAGFQYSKSKSGCNFSSVSVNNNGQAITGGDIGVFYSSDYGLTWSQVLSLANGGISSVYIDNQGNAIVGGYGGVWYSTKPGTEGSFNPVLSLENGWINSVYIDSQGNAIVGGYYYGQGGVWYSTTPSTSGSFNPVLSLASEGVITSVYIDNQGNAIVGGYSYADDNAVWYSTTPSTSGSFTPVLSVAGEGRITSVYIDSQGNAIVGGVFGQGGVWYSTDPGTQGSFTPVLSVVGGGINSVYIDTNGNAIVGGGSRFGQDQGGVWYSTDPGTQGSFNPVLSVANGWINSVYIDTKGNAIAGGYGGVWYSTTPNTPSSWQSLYSGAIINSVIIDNKGNAITAGSYALLSSYTAPSNPTQPYINLTLKFINQSLDNWANIETQVLSTVAATAGVSIGNVSVVSVTSGSIVVVINVSGFATWYAANSAAIKLLNIVFNPSLGEAIITYTLVPATPAISNICFPAGTPILTDRGVINIEQIDCTIHTINQQSILRITETVTLDKYLIRFEKNSLERNIPNKTTIMSKDHQIEFQGKLVPAYRFLDVSSEVKKVKYSGEILYNILLAKHGRVNVNGLICETLHPENNIAKLYNNYSEGERYTIINQMNDALGKRDALMYKEVVNKLALM